MTHEEINELDAEIRKVDFSGILRSLTDRELERKLLTIRAQLPKAYELMVKENSRERHCALLRLNALDDAIVAERLRRFDAQAKKRKKKAH